MAEFKPFNDARLKIERAKKHIDELNNELGKFLNRDFYRVTVEPDPQGGSPWIVFEIPNELPKHIGLIIGDAVHNTRCALDLVVSCRRWSGTA